MIRVRPLALPLLLVVLAATTACGSSRRPIVTSITSPADSTIAYLTPDGPGAAPLSPAVRVGNLLFLSGRTGSRPGAGNQLAPGGIEAETRQALTNISETLRRTGSSMQRVVKCTVMLADMDDWGRMNAVYAEFFPGGKPARSTFEVGALARDARVEIECIATVG
jgi:reactive intermediate/imine deaminase